MQQNENMTTPLVEEEEFDIRKIFSYAIAYWKLIVVFVVLCLVAAFAYLRVAVPKYQVTAKILLQDKNKGSFSSSADMLADFGFQAQNTNAENEMEVMRSMSVVRGAVAKSGLNVSYMIPGVINKPIYKEASPVFVTYGISVPGDVPMDSLTKLHSPIKMLFHFDGNGKAELEYSCYVGGSSEPQEFKTSITSYPYILNTPLGNVLVDPPSKGISQLCPLVGCESATDTYMG